MRFARRGTPARPRAGRPRRRPIRMSSPISVSSCVAPERGARQAHLGMIRARGEAEQRLVSRLAQVRDRVARDVRVAHASARERPAAPTQGDELAVRLEQLGVPRLPAVPRHRPPRVLAPGALEPDLRAGEDHRHAGRRHLQADPDELALPRAGDRPEADDVVAVEDRPRVEGRRPGHAGAEPASSSRTTDSPGSRGIPTGRSKNIDSASAGASSPRSHVHTGRVKPA